LTSVDGAGFCGCKSFAKSRLGDDIMNRANRLRPSSGLLHSGLRGAMLAGAAAVGFGASAHAASADQPMSTVQEVVVTAPHYVPTTNTSATKIAIPLIETPQSITVINRDQIDVLNVQNLSQAVRYTAGVAGENYGSDERYDWLTQRGFAPVEYINGLQAPVNSNSNTGIDLWGAESVEVLKGPSGVLYGQTPPGGLVNLTLRHPQAAFSAELQGQYGSFDDKQIAGDVTGSIVGDGVLEGRLTVLARDRDTQANRVTAKRLYIAPALTWNIDPDTRLTFLSYFQGDKIHGDGGGFLPAQGTYLPNPNGKIPVDFNAGDPDYNRFNRDEYSLGYEFEHKFSHALTLKQSLAYSSNKDDFHSLYGAGLQPDLQTLNRNIFVYPETTKQLAVDTRAEIRGSTGPIDHVGLVGVDVRDMRYSNDFGFAWGAAVPTINVFHPVYGQTVVDPTLYRNTREHMVETGVYGQDELKFGQWRLTLSAREDWLHTTNAGVKPVDDTAFTYRAGLNYVFHNGLAPYAAYSTSFLPTTGADFYNHPFVPSTGNQVELGVKYEPRFLPHDVKMFNTLAVYDLVQDHVLTNDPDSVNHPFSSVQTGQVEVKGVEVESVARIHESLNFNFAYAYTDSKVTKDTYNAGKQLPVVAPQKVSALVDYTWQQGWIRGFGLGVGVRYLSSAYGDPANTLPTGDVTLFDAMLHYNWEKWKIAVNASNLFDKTYVQRCSTLDQCFYGLRRDVTVTLDRKF
jgi:iron complex outermembrane receptor protein